MSSLSSTIAFNTGHVCFVEALYKRTLVSLRGSDARPLTAMS